MRSENPPKELRSSWEPVEPTGGYSCDEVTCQHVSPREAHVAGEASLTVEAF